MGGRLQPRRRRRCTGSLRFVDRARRGKDLARRRDVATGAEAVRRYLERFTAHLSEFEWLAEEFLESEDLVVMSARLRLRGGRSDIDVDRQWVYVFTVKRKAIQPARLRQTS